MAIADDDYQTLKAAAEAGDPAAKHALALRLFSGDRAPMAPGHAIRWILEAAAQDHTPSMQTAAVLVSLGLDGPADWRRAFDYVERAAALSDKDAMRQLELLGGSDFDFARAAVSPPAKTVMEQPRIQVIEGFLPPSWCDWVVTRAQPLLSTALIYAAKGLVSHSSRSNTTAIMRPEHSDLVLEMINARIASATGMPVSHQEITNVLHYEVGQEFKPHFDFINSGTYGRRDIGLYGQRIITLLIYLNDDFDGGETHFLHPDWRYRGAKGDAVMFWNLTSDGKPDLTTRHAGLAPTRGEKWLLSKWVHTQTMPSF